jgi:hypothetical protein
MTYIVLTKETSVYEYQGALHRSEEFRRPQVAHNQNNASEVVDSLYYFSDYGKGKYYSVYAKAFKKEDVERYYDTYGGGFLEELWEGRLEKADPNPYFYWL